MSTPPGPTEAAATAPPLAESADRPADRPTETSAETSAERAADGPASGEPAPALARLLGALLLAADKPLTVDAVVALVAQAVDEEEWPAPVTAAEVASALAGLAQRWGAREGFELVEGAQGWRLRSAPDLAPMLRRLWPERAVRLGKAALEALAVVAYRQPCTRLEVEDIRGVDCGGVLRSLLDRRLIHILGRKDEVGRPLLYGTTPEFLETFSLPDLRALPTLRDLESLETEAGVRARGAEVHGPPAAAVVERGEVEPGEVGPGEVEPDEVEPGEVEPDEVESDEVEPGDDEPAEAEAGGG